MNRSLIDDIRHCFIQHFNSFKEFFKLMTTKVQTTEAIVLKEKYFILRIKQELHKDSPSMYKQASTNVIFYIASIFWLTSDSGSSL